MSPNVLSAMARIRWIQGQLEPSATLLGSDRARSSPGSFRSLLEEAARRYGLDPALVEAVVRAESGFNPAATSPAGAMGLMQLMPATARALGVLDPYDPVQNVHGGVRYLRGLVDRFGDLTLALAAYNAGPAAVQRYGGVPPYPETRAYVERVLEAWRRGRAGLGGAP